MCLSFFGQVIPHKLPRIGFHHENKYYGEDKGRAVKYAEAFEVCEYGRQPSAEELKRLFPFFGQ
jgi:hypothetical protein